MLVAPEKRNLMRALVRSGVVPVRRRRIGGLAGAAAVLVLAPACTASSPPAAGTGSTASTPGTTASTSGTKGGGVGPGAAGPASTLQQQYQQVIRQVLPSVVEIRTTVGLGSGIIFDDSGDIVTNDHVVSSATSFQVLTAGSASARTASLVGTFPQGDLAVIKVPDTSGLRKASFADSSTVQLGTIVLAMGNPLGLASSVSEGIVSAVGRTLTEPQSADSPGATLPNSIQTSAAINPGNSGGALVNLQGEVIGIPTLAAQQQSGAAPGIGFAIPSSTVSRIAPQLIKNGKVTDSGRAALGITATAVADQQGNGVGAGIVAVTAGGGAAAAGLQQGDVIVKVAGSAVTSVQELSTVLAGLTVGSTVPVVVVRNGQQQTVQVTLSQLGTTG